MHGREPGGSQEARLGTVTVVRIMLGSSEGAYDVRISTVPSGPVFFAHGNAQVEKAITELQVDLNLPLTAPGRYVLQIRRPTSEWASFPLQVR